MSIQIVWKIKNLIKSLIPPFLLDKIKLIRGKTPKQLLQNYVKQGRVPWSPGYDLYKQRLITQTLKDKELLTQFKLNQSLPQNYGYGVDERCVEYPWLFSHFSQQTETVLDAGSVLNHEFILEQPIFEHKKLHILTLAPEGNCFYQKGIGYIYDDLRKIPIQDHYYDVVVCLSTLEHIGCDNSLYINNEAYQEKQLQDFTQVMQELNRVLKPGGSLFLSVPYGKYKNYGIFQQFDQKLLGQAIKAFGTTQKTQETFYQYTSQGWQVSNAEACVNCEYTEWIANLWKTKQTPSAKLIDPDNAAAARAVACIHFIK